MSKERSFDRIRKRAKEKYLNMPRKKKKAYKKKVWEQGRCMLVNVNGEGSHE